MKYDNSGYAVFDHPVEDEVRAKFNGYCIRCFHSFWKNEVVVKHPEGKKGFLHRDCLVALADDTPRRMSQGKSGFGMMDKALLKKKAKKAILSNR